MQLSSNGRETNSIYWQSINDSINSTFGLKSFFSITQEIA